MSTAYPMAPELQVSEWLNTDKPITLESLRGRVVLLHAFQMLCPGCVAHGLPQAGKVHAMFADSQLCVIGLHTVFEHHAVMGAAALKVFVHEYRLKFPIGIDRPATDDVLPLTMQAYALRGTPSLVLLDRLGRIRLHHFGQIDDLALGASIGQLIAESAQVNATAAPDARQADCDDDGCAPA